MLLYIVLWCFTVGILTHGNHVESPLPSQRIIITSFQCEWDESEFTLSEMRILTSKD